MKKELVFRLVLVLCIAFVVYQFGFKPYLSTGLPMGETVKKNRVAVNKPEEGETGYDVIVAGEEPDGIAAAVSASRTGARTLLVSESPGLGGTVTRALNNEFNLVYGHKKELLNRGFYIEIIRRLGKDASLDRYESVVGDIVKGEENLDVIYGAENLKPIMNGNTVVGVSVFLNGEEKLYRGKRIIDATKNGKLLVQCGVRYFEGSEDLNMKSSYMPVRLNFELEGVNYKDAVKEIETYGSNFDFILGKYSTSNVHIRIAGFDIAGNGSERVIVKGIEAFGLDVGNEKELKALYDAAVFEAKEFARFLSSRFNAFKNARFARAGGIFIIPEYRHFAGEYVLAVRDILENRDFKDKIAMGSNPVEAGKFAEGGKKYIVGKPVQYGMPIGCIIPAKVENILMTGGKISYSSLAASSAANMAVDVAVGQSAGIIAAYSAMKNVSPRQMALNLDEETAGEIRRLQKRQGMYLPNFNIENKNASHWCYKALIELCSLGLVAGGSENDYRFGDDAKQEDLGYILLNGVYRLSPEKYSLEFDSGVRPYLNAEKLTKDKMAEILLRFHGKQVPRENVFEAACRLGYIDEQAQSRLRNKNAPTLEDVYYVGAHNIKLYTGKSIL